MTSVSASDPVNETVPVPSLALKIMASPWLWLVAFWLFLHGAALFNAISPVVNGMLAGPDSYMRLVRIEILLNGGDWFSGVIARSNAPHGEILHWTRLFDMIVLGFSAPLFAVMPMKEALFWGGAFSSPVLHLALGWAVVRAAQTFDPQRRLAPAAIVAIGVLVQPAVFNYSMPGRSDHHTLLFLLFALVIWQMLAVLRTEADGPAQSPAPPATPHPARHGAWAGLAAAAGVWVSLELFSVVAIAAVGLGLGWLFGRHQRVMLRANLWFAGAFLLALVPFTLIEHGLSGFLTAKYDMISIVSVFAAAAFFAGWLIIALAQRVLPPLTVPNGWVWRLLVAGAGAGAAAAAIYLVFPGFFVGPTFEVNPRIIDSWLNEVQEMRPIKPSTPKGLAEFVNFLGLALIALPTLAWAFWRRPDTRIMTAALAIGAIMMVAASLQHVRFAPYAVVVLGIGLVGPVAQLLALRATARSLLAKTIVPVAGILAVFIFPFFAGNALNPDTARGSFAAAASAKGCNIRAMSAWLSAKYPTPVTILAMLDRGPSLLWFTRHRVIGTPYHRNHAGILAVQAALSTTDAATAKAVADDRMADLLLLCPNASEAAFAAQRGAAASASGKSRPTLYKRLIAGEKPAWLAPVTLPTGLGGFRLYAIRH